MKELKITEKTTKQGLVDVLKTATVKDKSLKARIKEALSQFAKDMTTVSKKDLFALAQEVLNATPAPVEASLKPKTVQKKKPVAEEKSTDEIVDDILGDDAEAEAEEEEVPEEKPKKSGKKSSLKKSKDSKKEDSVETVPPVSNVGTDSLPTAKVFPKEIDHPELGKLVACTGAYTSYKEILKALEADKTLYFACYWTKRQIKHFGYAQLFMIDPSIVKNGFPLDLDIAMAVLPCETMERVFAMSRITEGLYQFEGSDFKPIEDTDPRSGEKFQIRVSSGMEFEIYRPADESID